MWKTDPIVNLMVNALIRKGCTIVSINPPASPADELIVMYGNQRRVVDGKDIHNALRAAYRVAWQTDEIVKKFERYLIDLNNKRQALEKQ